MAKQTLPEYFEKMLDEKFKAQRDESKREFDILRQEVKEVKSDVKQVKQQIDDVKKNYTRQSSYFEFITRDVKGSVESNTRNIRFIRLVGIIFIVAIAPVWWTEVTTAIGDLIKIIT